MLNMFDYFYILLFYYFYIFINFIILFIRLKTPIYNNIVFNECNDVNN